MALQNPVLVCPECKKMGTHEQYPWHCECGEPYILSGEATIQFDDVKNLPKNFWRYRNVFPIKEVPSELGGLGRWTDLTPIEIDNRTVYVKQDYQLPSGSFKDRGASVMAAHVKEIGISEVVEDTSGNAGVALSYYAGKIGITCHIYSTTTINPVKERKIFENGAVLHKVSADRQAVTDETLRQVQKKYYASHTYNPYFLHGTKSIAYEIFEQLDYRVPDSVIVPVGNGTLILGIDFGFRELKSMGHCRTLPKLIGVQAAARCPIVAQYDNSVSPSNGEKNIAEGIDVTRPPRIRQIIRSVKESGGTLLAVTNEEILKEEEVRTFLGASIEWTSLTAVAGVRKYVKVINKKEIVVVPLTGANC